MSSQDNLFSAIDSLAAEEAKEIAGQGNGASRTEEGGEVAKTQTPPPASTGVSTSDEPHPVASYIEPKADLIAGATGSGKTVNIGRVADYVLTKYGKLTRMASTDPSGPGPLVGEVKAGKIEFWAPQAWPRPIEAMYKSTLGYWPLRPGDPESPLVPPDAGTFEVFGFGAFEGLTSYGDTIIDDLKKNKASLSQDPSYSWSQGDFTTSGGNQSYYGMMQDVLKQWVANTHLLRYEKILWTALESKGDDVTGAKVYGPMIGGKKATGKAGQWFVNFFHMDIIPGEQYTDKVTKQTMTKVLHILFLKTHIDPLSLIPFPCKVRAPIRYANEVPDYLISGDVAEAYKLLDSLYEKQMNEAIGQMNEVAGLRERLMEKAGKARLAEQAAAEKRAKANNLLKPMVSVPASPVTVPKAPVGNGPVVPKPQGPVGTGMPPVIQNVRKGK